MASTTKIIGWSLGIGATIAIIFGLMPDGWLRKLWAKITAPSSPEKSSSSSTATPEENTCVLRNNNGEEITINSKSNTELFRRYCQQGYTQPYYYNYIYYYPVRWWRRGGWHGNHGGNGNGNGGNGNGNGAPAM